MHAQTRYLEDIRDNLAHLVCPREGRDVRRALRLDHLGLNRQPALDKHVLVAGGTDLIALERTLSVYR